jgi:hypothetical protein
MRWLFSPEVERRRYPREPTTTPEAEAVKAQLRYQVTSLEDEIRTILLELQAGVYARDPNWRRTQ